VADFNNGGQHARCITTRVCSLDNENDYDNDNERHLALKDMNFAGETDNAPVMRNAEEGGQLSNLFVWIDGSCHT
jgi:hypothetical protein